MAITLTDQQKEQFQGIFVLNYMINERSAISVMLDGDDDHMEITEAILSPARPQPVPHTLQQPGPGWPLMDFISWDEFVFHTIKPGLGPEDIRDKTLRPSWKAGFNMVWTDFSTPGGRRPFRLSGYQPPKV